MRTHLPSIAALSFGVALTTIAAPLAPETPVIVDGPITVDVADVEGYLLRVPENRRAEVRVSRDRIASIADNIFIARSLAAKARAAGLDKDPTVQRRMQQVQDNLLADLYMQNVEKNAAQLNLEQRARELYLAEPSRFTIPEQVYVQHILIGLNGRTRDMAEERAKQVYEEVKSGKEEFLALAARLSDDPDKKRNGGDLGYSSPTAFVGPVAKQLATMKTKGEISMPVESHQGFHILKFIDRKAAETKKFEEVKKALIAEEKEKLAKTRNEEIITKIRSSSTVTVHLDKLDALVVPADQALSKASAPAPATAPAQADAPKK
jgi:peptidyl-prolyl cis-trans isomerase C